MRLWISLQWKKENLNCKALLKELTKTRTLLLLRNFPGCLQGVIFANFTDRAIAQLGILRKQNLKQRFTWDPITGEEQAKQRRREAKSVMKYGGGPRYGRLASLHCGAFWEALWKISPDHHPGREEDIYLTYHCHWSWGIAANYSLRVPSPLFPAEFNVTGCILDAVRLPRMKLGHALMEMVISVVAVQKTRGPKYYITAVQNSQFWCRLGSNILIYKHGF